MLKKEKKQMKLNNFCKNFDIPRSTALEWIHILDFPAYKIGGRWYVDVDSYYNWREKENEKHYA